MKDDTNLYNLSRRKLLGGLGAVGLASAGAGLGTTALFTDTESFSGNTLQAGELDLALTWYGQYNQSGVMGDTTSGPAGDGPFQTNQGTVDGEAGIFAYLEDVKPGDYGFVVICPSIQDNPAYLWMRSAVTEDSENEPNNEVENAAESSFTGTSYLGSLDASGGELDDVTNVWISYVDEAAETAYSSASPASDASTALVGHYLGSKGDVYSGTAAGLTAALDGGMVLDGDYPDATAPEPDPFAADDPTTDDNESAPPCIAIEFEVPFEVGNEIQGDSFVADFDFVAVQARHNDASDNPFAA